MVVGACVRAAALHEPLHRGAGAGGDGAEAAQPLTLTSHLLGFGGTSGLCFRVDLAHNENHLTQRTPNVDFRFIALSVHIPCQRRLLHTFCEPSGPLAPLPREEQEPPAPQP